MENQKNGKVQNTGGFCTKTKVRQKNLKKIIVSNEAKTHLSTLLKDIQKGDEVIITRRGKPVAKLIP